jgi:hypothetical protein
VRERERAREREPARERARTRARGRGGGCGGGGERGMLADTCPDCGRDVREYDKCTQAVDVCVLAARNVCVYLLSFCTWV